MRWPDRVLRGIGSGGPSRAVPGRPAGAPLGTNGRSCASGAITPAGPCRGAREMSHQRWIGVRPRKGRRLKRSVRRGPHGASLKTPRAGRRGARHLVVTTCCARLYPLVHRLRGAWRSPAFRATRLIEQEKPLIAACDPRLNPGEADVLSPSKVPREQQTTNLGSDV